MLKIERLSVAPGVYLSPVALSDAAALAALVKDDHTHLSLYLPHVAALDNIAAAREHLEHAIAAAGEGTLYEWHIHADGVLCGAVRVNQIDQTNRKAAVGYYIGSSHQGRGLATVSVRAVVDWCFTELGMNRMELRCASDNTASESVAKRVGFSWEGMLRQAEFLNGEFVDQFVYGLVKEDFRGAGSMEKAA